MVCRGPSSLNSKQIVQNVVLQKENQYKLENLTPSKARQLRLLIALIQNLKVAFLGERQKFQIMKKNISKQNNIIHFQYSINIHNLRYIWYRIIFFSQFFLYT